LSFDGSIRWLGAVIARAVASDDMLAPNFILLADEQLTAPAQERVAQRLRLWIDAHVATVLQPLVELRKSEELEGLARGIAFQLVEAYGVLDRRDVAEEINNLDQAARGSLRKFGVRFGVYHIFVPLLLKPAAASLLALLWGLKEGKLDNKGISDVPALSAAGRTSFAVDPDIPAELYRVAGFKVAGNRAVRIDILERLADVIRPLLTWKPSAQDQMPPDGALNEFGFTVTVTMTSLLGCAGEDFASVLKSLGYRFERREVTVKSPPPAEQRAVAKGEREAASDATGGDLLHADGDGQSVAAVEREAVAPTFIEIWRPQPIHRGGDKRKPEKSKKRDERDANGRTQAAKSPRKGTARQNEKRRKGEHKPVREEKPLDPDSPFAKLAALKAGLDRK